MKIIPGLQQTPQLHFFLPCAVLVLCCDHRHFIHLRSSEDQHNMPTRMQIWFHCLSVSHWPLCIRTPFIKSPLWAEYTKLTLIGNLLRAPDSHLETETLMWLYFAHFLPPCPKSKPNTNIYVLKNSFFQTCAQPALCQACLHTTIPTGLISTKAHLPATVYGIKALHPVSTLHVASRHALQQWAPGTLHSCVQSMATCI